MQNPNSESRIFEWYENRVEVALQCLHRQDRSERQKITEIVHEMSDSNIFWKLMAAYTTELEEANADTQRQHQALMAILARIYIAGSMRGSCVIECNEPL